MSELFIDAEEGGYSLDVHRGHLNMIRRLEEYSFEQILEEGETDPSEW